MVRALILLPFVVHACWADETVSGYADRDANWRLVEMNGATVAAEITIGFPTEGKVKGRAPCNNYGAAQTAPYPWFALDGILATKRACPDLDLENRYFAVLQEMRLIEVSGDLLLLTEEDPESGQRLLFRRN